MVATRLFLVLLSLLCGTIIGYIKLPVIGNVVNLFWGFMYGIGLMIGELLFGFRSGTYSIALTVILGGFVWPALLSAALYFWSGSVWRSASEATRWVLVFAFVVSILCVIPVDLAVKPPFERVRTWMHYFAD